MTFTGFRNRAEKRGPEHAEGARNPDARRHEPTGPTAYIGPGSEFFGKLRSKGTVRIDGQLKGEVRSEQNVIVAEGASVEASVEAESAFVSGEIRGDICARRKITLEKTARVTGNLSTPGIVIEEGAKLRGQIVIGSEDEVQPQPEAPASASERESSRPGSRGRPRREAGAPA